MIIGTGVDITEVRRLRQAIEKWGDGFLHRVFTKEELENSKTRGSLYQHLAGRFAAKEAVFKALGDMGLNWKDVQILNDKDGKPLCVIRNGKNKKLDVHISISHVKNYAVANAIITQKP
ncbi:MAG: holo-[acyl-carrier-protein] synthase [Omnitrophica WOR_2 bacterium RIFCSPLOWO2_01_FULL_41_12]|nr:MAG: holo-[acyl-carrier-protein] synthase [Omnitrophica WOR_2 bacterium RIFCSPLOWO2_01_FULL_41_12]